MMAATSQNKELFNDYNGFVEKFKPKKTTDDCYTPPNVMKVVQDYVAETYGVKCEDMVRPFWPGGDYEQFPYPAGCCVVDNPPFSMITTIVKEYQWRKMPFFLFCPYLTAGGITKTRGLTIIVAPASIRYENGADIPTAFVTNMEPENIIRGDSALLDKLIAADAENRSAVTQSLPKYEYPDHVLTVAKVGWFTIHHTPFMLKRSDCCVISEMDEQRRVKKSIFGSGFLLSERAAAERAAAERAAAQKWKLSEREWKMVEMLGKT